jgi:hypothetical protein
MHPHYSCSGSSSFMSVNVDAFMSARPSNTNEGSPVFWMAEHWTDTLKKGLSKVHYTLNIYSHWTGSLQTASNNHCEHQKHEYEHYQCGRALPRAQARALAVWTRLTTSTSPSTSSVETPYHKHKSEHYQCGRALPRAQARALSVWMRLTTSTSRSTSGVDVPYHEHKPEH